MSAKTMREFLLQEMATAPTLEVYTLAFQALENLARLHQQPHLVRELETQRQNPAKATYVPVQASTGPGNSAPTMIEGYMPVGEAWDEPFPWEEE